VEPNPWRCGGGAPNKATQPPGCAAPIVSPPGTESALTRAYHRRALCWYPPTPPTSSRPGRITTARFSPCAEAHVELCGLTTIVLRLESNLGQPVCLNVSDRRYLPEAKARRALGSQPSLCSPVNREWRPLPRSRHCASCGGTCAATWPFSRHGGATSRTPWRKAREVTMPRRPQRMGAPRMGWSCLDRMGGGGVGAAGEAPQGVVGPLQQEQPGDGCQLGGMEAGGEAEDAGAGGGHGGAAGGPRAGGSPGERASADAGWVQP
jgi:hypothetical protein